ncbi:calcium/sodium antiporter [Candidatus Woesearchaeota archaeon]|nr:calcium/sodium antiporter [Candidatus Woesearchaeota archaeon]
MLITNLIFMILSCFTLVKSSSFLVRSLAKISEYFRMNEFAIGFIIMAVSTSLPELFVGITAAIDNATALALGAVIGSNILDLTLVIGIVTLMARGIKIKSKIIRRDIVYMLGMVILPMLLMWDSVISRIDGLVLLAVFLFYIWQMVRQERSFSRKLEKVQRAEVLFWIIVAIVSVILLVFSAEFVVEFATRLSIDLLLPPILIGLFIIALGTSLPELIFESKAVLERHEELALGDLLGSVITNSTLVLGVTALIRPITANLLLFFSSAMFMVLIAFVFMTFAESEKGISWKEAVSLILLYMFFIVMESYIKFLKG